MQRLFDTEIGDISDRAASSPVTQNLTIAQYLSGLAQCIDAMAPVLRPAQPLRSFSAAVLAARDGRDVERNLAAALEILQDRSSTINRLNTALYVLPTALDFLRTNPEEPPSDNYLDSIWDPERPLPYERITLTEFFGELTQAARAFKQTRDWREGVIQPAAALAKPADKVNDDVIDDALEELHQSLSDTDWLLQQFVALVNVFPSVVEHLNRAIPAARLAPTPTRQQVADASEGDSRALVLGDAGRLGDVDRLDFEPDAGEERLLVLPAPPERFSLGVDSAAADEGAPTDGGTQVGWVARSEPDNETTDPGSRPGSRWSSPLNGPERRGAHSFVEEGDRDLPPPPA